MVKTINLRMIRNCVHLLVCSHRKTPYWKEVDFGDQLLGIVSAPLIADRNRDQHRFAQASTTVVII